MEFDSGLFDEVAMSCVVGDVVFEEGDAMTPRRQSFEQSAQQGCVAVAPRRTYCQTEEGYLHLAHKEAEKVRALSLFISTTFTEHGEISMLCSRSTGVAVK